MNPTNILIVDDEVDICWAFNMTLRDEGYHVTHVTRGEEALNKVKENAFDIAIIDVKLPGIGGIELSKMIKEINPEVKVVMMSGYLYGDDQPIQEGIQNGDYMGFISKPFNLDGVSSIVRKIANGH
ncbi:MAG: response regulator [Thermodesulfobacteriota bacterium]